jgi:hypothetical protein
MSDSEESNYDYNSDEEELHFEFYQIVSQINNQINEYGILENWMKVWIWRQFYQSKDQNKLNELLSIKHIKQMYENRFNRKKWLQNFNNLRRYILQNDKIPTMKNDSELMKWLQNQKTLFRSNKLDINKVNKLFGIKYVEDYIKSSGREKWDKLFEEVKEFIKSNGYLPSYSVYSDKNEKKIAKWLTTQIQVMKGKRDWNMSVEHKDKLMEIDLIRQRVNCNKNKN